MSTPGVGTVVLAGYASGPNAGLGWITKVGRYGAADGYWILAPTGDPNSTTEYPVFTQTVKVAVIGKNVCHKPRGGACYCGYAHVSREALTWLPRVEADDFQGEVSS